MGVIEQIARLFGRSPGGGKAATSSPAADLDARANGTAGHAMDRKPVNIDVYLEDDDERDLADGLIASAPAPTPPGDDPIEVSPEAGASETDGSSRAPIISPRNRQELIKELQKNYTEVLGLVRKVDDHLDTQSQRSERLLELAERSARNMDAIPELVEQNRRVADALGDLIELTRDARTRNDAAVDRLNKTAIEQLEAGQRQTAALQSMQSAIHRSGEAEAEMARSIGGFNETLTDMSASTRDLGDTISQLRETDAEREAELAKLVSSGQKWLVAAVVLCALMAVIVVGLVVNGVV
jgi:methyl-accepting chemotaxis protein